MEGSCSPLYYSVTASRSFTTVQDDIKQLNAFYLRSSVDNIFFAFKKLCVFAEESNCQWELSIDFSQSGIFSESPLSHT